MTIKTTAVMTTKVMTNSGPDSVDAFGWLLQRGYVFRATIDAQAWKLEDMTGEPLAIGYHGDDVPPCGADYLYGDDNELLVISREADPASIDCLPGVTLERITLEEGEHRHDGVWRFRVLEVKSDGETLIAGKC